MSKFIIGTLNSPNMYSMNVEPPERNDEHTELCTFYNSPDHYQIDLLKKVNLYLTSLPFSK